MPRSVQAFRQNARLTHSPANVNNGDPTQAVDDGASAFKKPSALDICAPVTQGTNNPFMAGLNTMGDGTGSSTGVPGQTGNMLSGLQIFVDALCGHALGSGSVSETLQAARQLRASGLDLHETLDAVRRLRDTVGTGTTPQSVLTGVEAVSGVVSTNPLANKAIAKGIASSGATGNQTIDGINGAQSYAVASNLLLTGKTKTDASGDDLLSAGGNTLNQNNSKHVGHQSLTTAQSVNIINQNLLVSNDFASNYSVTDDPTNHWAWDGTDGDPATSVMGCLKCVCDGRQPDYLSNEIPIVAGENIEVSATVKWSGLVYSGASPIVLGVAKFRQMKDADGHIVYNPIGTFDVATMTSPGTSSSSKFVGLAGVYTGEPGVDQIRIRVRVAPNAVSGTVKWDNLALLKTDLIANDAVPGVGQTVDSIVTQLYGTQGSGFTQNQAAVALGNTASSLASVSAKVAQLDAEGHTGAIAGDDFNYSAELIASGNWGGSYVAMSNKGATYSSDAFGTYIANEVDAVWNPQYPWKTGTTDCHFNWAGTDSVSTTDYQLVQVVLDSPPGYTDQGTPPGIAYLYVIGRVSSDWQNYIKLKVGGDGTYYVIRCVAGVETVMDSGTCAVPGSGSTVSLYCGDKNSSTLRMFTAQVGSVTISSFTESGSASQAGSSYRGWGFGGLCRRWIPWVTPDSLSMPPSVNQWLGMDQ